MKKISEQVMRAKSFSGGYRFKGFKGQARDELIHIGVPSKVIIPMIREPDFPLKPAVKIGDRVFAGQVIAYEEGETASPILSSINGRVVEIREIDHFSGKVAAVIIEGNEDEDYRKVESYTPQWEELPPRKIEELLYRSGVASLEREGIPTHFKTSTIIPEEVEDIIIYGTDSDIYNLSLGLLLKGEGAANFVEGMKILKRIMPQARVHLALNKERKGIIKGIRKLTSDLDGIEIYPLAPKYPLDRHEILIPTLLNKRISYGSSAADVRVVVLSVQTVLHVFEAVAEGKPLIERIVALCGPSFKENVHVKVRIGTPLEFILKDRLKEGDHRIVANSLLTGFELKDLSLPVDRTFSQIIAIPENRGREFLAFLRPGLRRDSYSRSFLSAFFKAEKRVDTNLHGEERPCIQCGYCIEVCPVRIIPTLINRYIRLGIDETVVRYGIFNCIDCNLCSYVCPSKISLARNLREAKEKLKEMGLDRTIHRGG
ncbi:TPA: 4Fe-4S dicluster domain-containing protein [Candidatus Poribacteria bacterium]|nr:4Fe-4S dicluster domain-containing protein [Candidatus Poribacteria bacterium]